MPVPTIVRTRVCCARAPRAKTTLDTAAAAKAITTFNKEHDVLTYKGGLMGETVLDDAAFQSIARLPSREVLVSQFAGIVASPLTGLVRGLGSLIGGLALQLGRLDRPGMAEPVAGTREDDPPFSREPHAAQVRHHFREPRGKA